MLALDITIVFITAVASACLWKLEYYGISVIVGIISVSFIVFILYIWRKR